MFFFIFMYIFQYYIHDYIIEQNVFYDFLKMNDLYNIYDYVFHVELFDI
jgi:hypothetical protein